MRCTVLLDKTADGVETTRIGNNADMIRALR